MPRPLPRVCPLPWPWSATATPRPQPRPPYGHGHPAATLTATHTAILTSTATVNLCDLPSPFPSASIHRAGHPCSRRRPPRRGPQPTVDRRERAGRPHKRPLRTVPHTLAIVIAAVAAPSGAHADPQSVCRARSPPGPPRRSPRPAADK